MKVAFHSPLPPARSGVADYAAALLRALRAFGEVVPNAALADVHLYHLGNNQLHREIYRAALERPGVLVLHDAVLQHFFLGAFDEEAYVEEFAYNYGPWSRGEARELYRRRAVSGSSQRYYRYPMLRRIAERSRAIVVHNPGAARMVREHCPSACVVEIPHLFETPALPPTSETLRFRQRLGIPLAAVVFGVFGYLRESKRLLPLLRVFQKLHGRRPETRLLVAGDIVSSGLARAAAPLLDGPGILRAGYLPEGDFWRYGALADVCISLRYPAAGETSGITVRMMGVGKPVLVTESEETDRYPEGACLRVAPGVAESASLLDHMSVAAASKAVTSEVGRRAAEYIRARHALERAAGMYWDTLCEFRG